MKCILWEFSDGLAGSGSCVFTTVALVTAVAQLQSLAWELPHAAGVAKRKKEKKREREPEINVATHCLKEMHSLHVTILLCQ